MKHGGSLHNVPETLAAPLAPFVVAPTGKAAGSPPLRARGELVPIAEGEVLLGLHAVRGELPASVRALPDRGVLAAPVLTLKLGAVAAIAVDGGGDLASTAVLVVRCVEVAARTVDAR
jgi:hypothetical protein